MLARVTRFPVERAAPLSPAEKLKLSLQMFEYGCQLMRENLRRQHPELDAEALERALQAWLRNRSDTDYGGGPMRLGKWPRGVNGD